MAFFGRTRNPEHPPTCTCADCSESRRQDETRHQREAQRRMAAHFQGGAAGREGSERYLDFTRRPRRLVRRSRSRTRAALIVLAFLVVAVVVTSAAVWLTGRGSGGDAVVGGNGAAASGAPQSRPAVLIPEPTVTTSPSPTATRIPSPTPSPSPAPAVTPTPTPSPIPTPTATWTPTPFPETDREAHFSVSDVTKTAFTIAYELPIGVTLDLYVYMGHWPAHTAPTCSDANLVAWRANIDRLSSAVSYPTRFSSCRGEAPNLAPDTLYTLVGVFKRSGEVVPGMSQVMTTLVDPTPTPTPTLTPTPTPTLTPTPTPTLTPTPTPTLTPTPTPTNTPTPLPTPVVSLTVEPRRGGFEAAFTPLTVVTVDFYVIEGGISTRTLIDCTGALVSRRLAVPGSAAIVEYPGADPAAWDTCDSRTRTLEPATYYTLRVKWISGNKVVRTDDEVFETLPASADFSVELTADGFRGFIGEPRYSSHWKLRLVKGHVDRVPACPGHLATLDLFESAPSFRYSGWYNPCGSGDAPALAPQTRYTLFVEGYNRDSVLTQTGYRHFRTQ